MRRFIGPIIFGVLGILLVIGGIGWMVSNISSLANSANSSTWTTPGVEEVTLGPGEYSISQLSSTSTGVPSSTLIKADAISVIGPDGAQLPIRCANCGVADETITLGSDVFSPVATFDVTTAGTYTITVSEGVAQVAVTPSLASLLGGITMPFIPIGLGGLFILIAIVWLIIALVTGKKKRAVTPAASAAYLPPNQAPPAGQPVQPSAPARTPAGWYPDPDNANQQRWWNGSEWTDQTFPK